MSEKLIESIIKKCPENLKDNRPDAEQRWCLMNKDNTKLLGRHPSKEKALAQERAIQVHKHGNVIRIADEIIENYLGETSFDYGHSHKYKTDDAGNGLTNNVMKHLHTVTEFKVQAATDGHRHLINFEEAKHERKVI
jgi:hypothetical protein